MPPSTTNADAWAHCKIGVVFDLPENVSYITFLRKKARDIMRVADLSQADADDLEVIIGELATNVVRHASGTDYRVSLEITGNQAVISVVDNGNGFAPEVLPLPGTVRPDTLAEAVFERIGGFGLPLVQSLSDAVEIVPNPARGMTVRAMKSLQHKL